MEYYLFDTFSPNCFLAKMQKAGKTCHIPTTSCGNNLECYQCSQGSVPICISGDHYILILTFYEITFLWNISLWNVRRLDPSSNGIFPILVLVILFVFRVVESKFFIWRIRGQK